ncbi:hypothetical protein CPB86DRAFT_454618 [Serendipita vermifera]|nr:hypothetical protein CPB86DRAFT_454618 [Serendipita vermifera]
MKVFFINVVPLILAAIASIIFNVLTLVNVVIRRRKRLDADATERPNPPIIKHLLHTSSSTVLMIFGNVWGIQPYVKDYFLNMHDRENYPVFVPFSEVMKTKPQKSFYTRFILDVIPDTIRLNSGFILSLPLIEMYFFAFFGFGKEARKTYRDNIKWVAHLLGRRQEDVERSGQSDAKQPFHFFSIQRKKFVAMFKRVFPRNRSRRIPVVPFEIPSDASSGHIEKEILDIRPTAPNNANRPQRRSMHKPRLPPSRSSDAPIEDEEAQTHSLVAPSEAQSSSLPPNLPSDSPDDIIQTGLQSLPRPQRKAPLPPPDRRTNSIDDVQRHQPQIVPLPVPPPAYSPETSRERQHLV